VAAVAPTRPSATHRPCSFSGEIAASVGLKGCIVSEQNEPRAAAQYWSF